MRRHAAVRVVGPLHWVVYPALICLALAIAFATPVRFLGFPPPEPVFPMMLAFAWPLIRPSMVGPVVLFFLGLFEDYLFNTPTGLWTLGLLGVYGVILVTRHLIIGQDHSVLFGWWLGAVGGAFTFDYLLVWAINQTAPSLIGFILQLAVTLCLFPFSNGLVQRFDDGDVRFR
jgi:rod shape-determining protein MreD